MAISDDVPGLEICIVGDGRTLVEYEDKDITEEERTTTRFVQATSGQHFAILFNVAKGTNFKGDSLCCEIKIDGTVVKRHLLNKAYFRDKDYSSSLKGCEAPGEMIRKFSFASLETGNVGSNERSSTSLIQG